MLDRTTTIIFAVITRVAVCALGWVAVDQFMSGNITVPFWVNLYGLETTEWASSADRLIWGGLCTVCFLFSWLDKQTFSDCRVWDCME